MCKQIFNVQTVTLCTHGNFIVLPHREPGHQHDDRISHLFILSWRQANQSLPYPNNAEHLARKWQVSNWFDSNPWGSNPWSAKRKTSGLPIRPPCTIILTVLPWKDTGYVRTTLPRMQSCHMKTGSNKESIGPFKYRANSHIANTASHPIAKYKGRWASSVLGPGCKTWVC